MKKQQKNKPEFHGYVGSLAMLNNGETVRIIGGHNMKLFVRRLDGTIKECYHDDLKHIWDN